VGTPQKVLLRASASSVPINPASVVKTWHLETAGALEAALIRPSPHRDPLNKDRALLSRRWRLHLSLHSASQPLFCRPDQYSRDSYVDDNSCLISEKLAIFILHDVFASRHLHIRMLRNDYTVPTRCRRRGGMVDPLGCKTCRAIR
jgi:hypothetical protein